MHCICRRQAATSSCENWVAFATSGNPNAPGLPDWPAVTAKSDPLLDFQADGQAVAKADPWVARLDVTEANAVRSR